MVLPFTRISLFSGSILTCKLGITVPMEFVAEALSPAQVLDVIIIDEAAKSCRVIVPDQQLSLAIGNRGQNARLAARLTGWKIDIRSETDTSTEE